MKKLILIICLLLSINKIALSQSIDSNAEITLKIDSNVNIIIDTLYLNITLKNNSKKRIHYLNRCSVYGDNGFGIFIFNELDSLTYFQNGNVFSGTFPSRRQFKNIKKRESYNFIYNIKLNELCSVKRKSLREPLGLKKGNYILQVIYSHNLRRFYVKKQKPIYSNIIKFKID